MICPDCRTETGHYARHAWDGGCLVARTTGTLAGPHEIATALTRHLCATMGVALTDAEVEAIVRHALSLNPPMTPKELTAFLGGILGPSR